MASKIEYVVNEDGTQGEAWNPIRGTHGMFHCIKLSPGCDHCYAEAMGVRLGTAKAYEPRADTPTLNTDALLKPLSWTKPRTVFVQNMSDLFLHTVPTGYIAAMFGVMALCPQHTFLVLTKRPLAMGEFIKLGSARRSEWRPHMCLALANAGAPDDVAKRLIMGMSLHGDTPQWPLPNVWLGTSVEDQKRADSRIPLLVRIQGAPLWVSVEPMLESVTLPECAFGLEWVVCGCESGKGARHMDLAWALKLRDQCDDMLLPFYLKQIMRDGELVKKPTIAGRQHVDLPFITSR